MLLWPINVTTRQICIDPPGACAGGEKLWVPNPASSLYSSPPICGCTAGKEVVGETCLIMCATGLKRDADGKTCVPLADVITVGKA